MEIETFEETNSEIGEGNTAFRVYMAHDNSNRIVICWKLGWFERLTLLITGRVWHQVLVGHGQLQDTAVTVYKPYMPIVVSD